VVVNPERWREYPYFFESFEQYGIELPRRVTVRSRPLRPFLEVFDDPDEEEEFIEQVTMWMSHGDDIPPVLMHKGTIFDGRHRAWAAHRLGLRRAPVVDITPYWK
jgi:hypothetical protein